MTNQQILYAIENYPADFPTSIGVICDIYNIDMLYAYNLVQSVYGPLHDNTPLLK